MSSIKIDWTASSTEWLVEAMAKVEEIFANKYLDGIDTRQLAQSYGEIEEELYRRGYFTNGGTNIG